MLVFFLAPFPDTAFTNEEAAGCINEESKGAINEAAIGAIIAPKKPTFFFYFMFTVSVVPSINRSNF